MAFIRQTEPWWRPCPTSRNSPFPVLLSSSDATFCAAKVWFVTATLPWGPLSLPAMGGPGYFLWDGARADEATHRSLLTSKRRWAQRQRHYAPARVVSVSPHSSCLLNLQLAHRNRRSDLISRPCKFLPRLPFADSKPMSNVNWNWTADVPVWKMEGEGRDLPKRISSAQHSIQPRVD
jgi:hypothetical protein